MHAKPGLIAPRPAMGALQQILTSLYQSIFAPLLQVFILTLTP